MTKQVFTSFDTSELQNLIKEALKQAQLELTRQEPSTPKYCTRREAAEELQISLPTLNKYTKTGKVIGYRIGGKVMYRVDELMGSLKKIKT